MTPHNGYAQPLTEAGVPIFVALVIRLVSMLLQLGRSFEPIAVAIHASIFGVLIWMLFHDGFYERCLWILLGVGASIASRSLSTSRAT